MVAVLVQYRYSMPLLFANLQPFNACTYWPCAPVLVWVTLPHTILLLPNPPVVPFHASADHYAAWVAGLLPDDPVAALLADQAYFFVLLDIHNAVRRFIGSVQHHASMFKVKAWLHLWPYEPDRYSIHGHNAESPC